MHHVIRYILKVIVFDDSITLLPSRFPLIYPSFQDSETVFSLHTFSHPSSATPFFPTSLSPSKEAINELVVHPISTTCNKSGSRNFQWEGDQTLFKKKSAISLQKIRRAHHCFCKNKGVCARDAPLNLPLCNHFFRIGNCFTYLCSPPSLSPTPSSPSPPIPLPPPPSPLSQQRKPTFTYL